LWEKLKKKLVGGCPETPMFHGKNTPFRTKILNKQKLKKMKNGPKKSVEHSRALK
jgi:hypothetical protein